MDVQCTDDPRGADSVASEGAGYYRGLTRHETANDPAASLAAHLLMADHFDGRADQLQAELDVLLTVEHGEALHEPSV